MKFCSNHWRDQLVYNALLLSLSLFLFRTHFITLDIFSRLLLCVSVFALQYFVWFFFIKSSLVYFIVFFLYFCILYLTTIQCVRLKWTLRVCFYLECVCVCEKGAWLVHFRRSNQNMKKINGNKHMFKRKATSKPWFRYVTLHD